MDKISVIVPIYKVENYLNRCIESIVNQTYKNLEIILVDDGSPDNCGNMCDDWSEKDERILVVHKANGGQGAARNLALDICVGQYIVFVDSDDYLELNMIATLYENIVVNAADVVACNYYKVNEAGVRENVNIFKNNIITDKHEILRNISKFVVPWGKIYKRDIFNEIRYPIDKFAEDSFISYLIMDKCKKIQTLKNPLCSYLIREGSDSNTKFELKHLDKAESYLKRAEFFIEYKLYIEAIAITRGAVNVLVNGNNNLDLNNKDCKARLYELDKKFNSLFYKLLLRKGQFKSKVIIVLYYLNKKLICSIRK